MTEAAERTSLQGSSDLEIFGKFFDARFTLLYGNVMQVESVLEQMNEFSTKRCNSTLNGFAAAQEEAEFVISLLTGTSFNKKKKIAKVLLSHTSESVFLNAVAKCYAAEINNDGKMMMEAAEMGHPFAQALMSSVGPNSFIWATRSAQQNDRLGLQTLAYHYEQGDGCEVDYRRSIALFKQAALLGDMHSMYHFGLSREKNDPQRYYWLGKAAYGYMGHENCFSEETMTHMKAYNDFYGAYCNPVLFMIGRMCKMFILDLNHRHFSEAEFQAKKKASALYDMACANAKKSTLCWMLCAKHLGLYRDVSGIIGRLVWEGRDSF